VRERVVCVACERERERVVCVERGGGGGVWGLVCTSENRL